MMVGDYIIGIKTVRGQSKKDHRYKILNIQEKGKKYVDWLEWEYYQQYDRYLIIHSGRWTYSDCIYFEYDYKYNRKLKLKKLKKI